MDLNPAGGCEPPTTEAECSAAAAAAGLTEGGGGFDFVGEYSTGGCYTYDDASSQYYGMAYWSASGSEEPATPKARVCMEDVPAPFEVYATCAPGFEGTAVASPCTSDGEYALSGCSGTPLRRDAASR